MKKLKNRDDVTKSHIEFDIPENIKIEGKLKSFMGVDGCKLEIDHNTINIIAMDGVKVYSTVIDDNSITRLINKYQNLELKLYSICFEESIVVLLMNESSKITISEQKNSLNIAKLVLINSEVNDCVLEKEALFINSKINGGSYKNTKIINLNQSISLDNVRADNSIIIDSTIESKYNKYIYNSRLMNSALTSNITIECEWSFVNHSTINCADMLRLKNMVVNRSKLSVLNDIELIPGINCDLKHLIMTPIKEGMVDSLSVKHCSQMGVFTILENRINYITTEKGILLYGPSLQHIEAREMLKHDNEELDKELLNNFILGDKPTNLNDISNDVLDSALMELRDVIYSKLKLSATINTLL